MKTHYPNHMELLLFFSKAFDVQKNSKTLYEKSQDPYVSKEVAVNYLAEMLCDLKGSFSEDVIQTFEHEIIFVLDEYLSVVASHTAEGVLTEDLRKLLVTSCLPGIVAKILCKVSTILELSPLIMVDSDYMSVSSALDWLDNQNKQWASVNGGKSSKEVLDQISSWRRGDNLPKLTSIKLLNASNQHKTILLIARAMDFLRTAMGRPFVDEVRAIIFGASPLVSLSSELQKIRNQRMQESVHLSERLSLIQNLLKTTTVKKAGIKDTLFKTLSSLKGQLKSLPWGDTTINWIRWHKARWYVFNGDMVKAVSEYAKAVDAAIFCAGPNQWLILHEALAVTSYTNKPDMVSLRRFKIALTNFGFDVPSMPVEKHTVKASDYIQNWEIDAWRSLFTRLFPEQGWFPDRDNDISALDDNTGLIWLDMDKDADFDFKKPDRHKTYGIKGGKRKKMPQLLHAIEIQDYESFKRLMDAGADINVTSKSGDTPILYALSMLSKVDFNSSYDRRFFDEIAKLKHKPDIIDTKTEKRKLTPLMRVIDTCDIEIVEKVISMGANVNIRCNIDDTTPLYYCLCLIATTLDNSVLSIGLSKPAELISDEEADAVRRYSNSLAGRTLEEVRKNKSVLLQSPRKRQIHSALKELFINMYSQLEVSVLKKICLLLLENGADPNALNNKPVNGYTPFMLSAEIGDLELFKLLEQNGGHLGATYYSNPHGHISLMHIAAYFQSKEIFDYLRSKV